MKRWQATMCAGAMLASAMVQARAPRPDDAVAQLHLDEALRTRVLAVFEHAHARHEALRATIDRQRAENDTAFCAIRRDTRIALSKLLSTEQMAALDANLRPPERDDGPSAPGGRGPMGHAPDGMAPNPGERERGGMGRPHPPRCDDSNPR